MHPLIARIDAARGFAVGNVVIAAAIALAVFGASPTRSRLTDVPAVVLMILLVISAVALAARHRRAAAITRVAAVVLLVAGLAAAAAFTLGLTYHHGMTGAPIGPALFVLGLLLVLPYTVFYALGLLWWLAPRRENR